MSFALVFLGGGLGSLARFCIQLVLGGQSFYHALIPNLVGCFLIGLCTHAFVGANETLKLLFVIGFLGGFTTFSSYVAFIGQSGFYTHNISFYFLLNNCLGLLLYVLGSKLV